MTPDWHEFLCALIDHRVKFLVVGGIALAAHAEPRFTKDLDVLVEATLANGCRLRAALVDFGFGAVAPDPSELVKAGPGWLLGRTPHRIDILTEIDGVNFRRAWGRRVHATLDERRRVPVIGRDDLLAAKLAAGRPQDLADAARWCAGSRRRTKLTSKRPSETKSEYVLVVGAVAQSQPPSSPESALVGEPPVPDPAALEPPALEPPVLEASVPESALPESAEPEPPVPLVPAAPVPP